MTSPLTIDQPGYFDHLAQIEGTHWWSRGLWRLACHWLDAALKERRGLVALDVGCGAGMTLVRLRDRPEINEVFAIDPSGEALQHAHRFSASLAFGSALRLPFRSYTFDLVTCFDVLQHLPAQTEAAALREIRRVLRRGGLALVRANGRGWAVGAAPRRPPYCILDLAAMVRAEGLDVLRATYVNCVPALAQELRARMSPGPERAHPEGGGLRIRTPSPWINRVMGLVASAEATLAGPLRVRLPFGHSTMVLAKSPD